MFKQPRSEVPTLADIVNGLDTILTARARDPNVVAFKSIICYRTGLNLEMNLERCADGVASYIVSLRKKFDETGTVRIAHAGLNSLIVHTALLIAGRFNKPGERYSRVCESALTVSSLQCNFTQGWVTETCG